MRHRSCPGSRSELRVPWPVSETYVLHGASQPMGCEASRRPPPPLTGEQSWPESTLPHGSVMPWRFTCRSWVHSVSAAGDWTHECAQRPARSPSRCRQRPSVSNRGRPDGGSPVRHGVGQTGLRRLDDHPAQQLEDRGERARDPAHAAVRAHQGQELDRQRADHRRDGPALHGPVPGVLHRLVRQRLHPARLPHPRARHHRLRVRRAQDACLLPQRL